MFKRRVVMLTCTWIIALAALLALTSLIQAQDNAENPDPFAPIFGQITASGQYDFIAQIEQTLIPRPIPANIGATEQRIDSQLSGEVVLPDYARVNLQFEADTSVPPFVIEQVGSDTFLIKDEERTQIENPLGVAPSTDFIGYMQAAENIQVIERPEQPHLTVYSFDIDGKKFADYFLQITRSQLPVEDQNATLVPPPSLLQMSGSGELWVDAEGYPQRQILDIHMPDMNERYDAQSHIVVDFNFTAPLAGVPLLTTDNVLPEDSPATAVASNPPANIAPTTTTNITLPQILLAIFSLVFVVVMTVLIARSHRLLRVSLPITLAVIIVAAPILQPFAHARTQEQTQEAALPSLGEAFGVVDIEETNEVSLETAVMQPNTPLQQQNLAVTSGTCGAGSVNDDTDLDGTNDFVENCLGTNPFNIDTDLDGITDTLEIDGFVFTNTMNIPHTFYSNPHEFDTNRDGLNDNLEWPFPIGDAPSIDPDGDDLPNLWDSDNDNDGITDGSDMDPYTVTAYQPHFSIQTSLNGSTYNGHQYIEFQVQPQDESHLRLVTTELDWPYDDKGSLQAQDVTNQEEMTFVPLLKVVTNNVPSQELQQMYGVSVVNQGSSHIMYLDLQPIGDGGKIAAFQGKVAYGPGDLADINWSKVELVWMVMMKSTPPGATDPTDYETVPVAEYAEPNFRFAGLEVTKSGTTKYGIIGTPAAQTDHRQLANLVMGLEGSFLATAVPDFDTIVGRLSTPTTPLTQTWGIPVNDIAVGLPPTQPTHMDAALQQPNDTYSTISTFLTDNSYNTSEMASVIMALEAEAGRDSLDGDAIIAGNTLTFNLANIPVAQTRSLTLSHYQYVNNKWDDMDDTEAINTLISSYDNDPAVVLADLQQFYPELTDVDLANLLSAFYLLWLHGQNTLITIDGVYVVEETEENTLINDQINLPSVTDTLTYIIEANNLGVVGKSLVFNDPQSYQQYQDATLTMPGNLGLRLASNTYTLLMRGWQTFSLIVWNGKLGFRSIQYSANGMHKAGQWLFGANKVSSYTTLGGTKITKVLPQKAGLLGKWHKVSGWVSKHSRLFTKIGLVLRVAAFIFTVVMIWVNYANFSSPYSFEEEYAAIYASLDTLFTTISFILAFTGFGAIIILIFFIFDMIGLIITAIAGIPVDSIVTTAITKFFADFRQYSKVGGLAFNGISSSINGSGYQVTGNTLTLADIFEGEIDGYTNHMDKLLDSDIVGYFNARAGSDVSVSTTDNRNYPYRCQVGGSILFCRNWLKANYQFNQAGRDQKIEFLYKVKAVTQFAQYSFFGTIRTDREDVMYLPDELDAKDRWHWVPVYIDVLPNTLDGLLTWGELTNHDPDGDDIVTTIEDDIVNTDIDGDGIVNWQDWDRDGDDLADKFEEASNTSLGTNANIQDTDGDTLDDGLELMLGTGINQVDSDNDGLHDNVEQFHWNGSAWTGGGWFIDINGQNYWVFSDPTANDRDLDGLNDSSEQLNGTSPNAFNAAPQLELAAEPLTTSPDDFTGIYVKNGDPVTSTLRLFNTGSSVIDDTFTFCVPAALSSVNVVASGDSVPPTVQNGDCYSWDFSSDNLLLFQSFNVDMSAVATGSTVTGTISATLPYQINNTPQPVSVIVPYVQDNTAPTVQVTDPLADSILTSQYYVVGGTAGDATSWVDNVQVTVDSGTYTATLTDAQWGYTWQLPPDGVVDITAVATDALGNVSSPATVQVTVDTLPPVITVNLAEGATISAAEAYSTTFPLNGTASDNYAGIERVQMRYNRGNWRTIWDDDTQPLNANWDGTWEIPTIETAQGKHNLYLRAYDAYGNASTITRTVFIDVLPPTNELTNRAFVQETPKHVPGGQPVTLFGVASDAGNNPLPPDPSELSGDLHSISDATVWLQLDDLSENDGGAAVAWLGDVNGDRLGDLAVGLPAANGGTGKVVVVKGKPGGWPTPNIGALEFLRDNTPSFVGTAGAGIGAIIKPAGDVNGDGLDDYLIGDPANERVVLVLGSTAHHVTEQELDGTAVYQIPITTQAGGESLSSLSATQVAGVGDVTNDGLSDIMVTVTTAGGSRAYLLTGENPYKAPQQLDALAAAVFDSAASGVSVAGVGDVNNDFIPDFAVAANGSVYLFAGGGGWIQGGLTPLATGDAIFTFATADSLPTIVGLGDVNGDAIDDFAFSSGPSPVVVFGNGSNSFGTQILGGFPSPLSGFLASVGDVDKDGRGDLLIGNDDGDAYLIDGNDLSSAAATIEGVETAAAAPYIAGADLVGDGSSDIVLVPSASAATALGYDGFGSLSVRAPFIERTALPVIGSDRFNLQVEPAGRGALLSGDVTVGPTGADYTSIQTAINSGASRVLVQPGIYAEAITLTNNVAVIGSGADRTVLTFPKGVAPAVLVEANGVSNASLLNLTLLSEGSGVGLAVSNGATNIKLERTVVQGMATAVSVNGSATTLTLKNNTIIGNSAGFVAGSDAGVDIRNTLFAYNTGTAVQYDNSAVLKLHQYNLYYANGSDLSPNNPGGGELFSNPLFLDYGSGDLRTELFSPVIDAGTPNDPVPPGAGTAVDIGHMEQTGSSFFVDDDYCDGCLNDGLIWNVDAFNTIQDAVNAAQADIAALQTSSPLSFTVGVNGGVYTDSVVISSSVQLLGRAPDQTTIQAGSGPAVTFRAAVNAGVAGFTLQGGGAEPIGVLLQEASNRVAIDYNLIKNNSVGISVTQRSTASGQFNTIISNTTGVKLGRGTYWNTVVVPPGVQTKVLRDTCFSTILCEERGYLWLNLSHSIISGNTEGLTAVGESVLFSNFNLLYNTIDYNNVISGLNDIIDQDPLLTSGNGYLQAGSPAVDAASAVAPVPPGGGLLADLGWHELRAAPVSVFMGQPDESLATESIGVGQVEYAVVAVANLTATITSTLPTTWTLATLDNPGEKLTYWQTDYNAGADGYYRVYSRASDTLGNVEADVAAWYDGAFVVDSSPPAITLTVSNPYPFANWRVLEAEVVDYVGSSFDIDDIYFTIDGERVNGRWRLNEWTPDGSSPRTFFYLLQNNSGVDMTDVAISAIAQDGAGNTASDSTTVGTILGDVSWIWQDTIPPSFITVTNPLPGDFVAGTVTFAGEVGDFPATNVFEEVESLTDGVELSFDGGVTWHTARSWEPSSTVENVDRYWEYDWQVPGGLDATTIPVRIRAWDNAGLSSSAIFTVTVDTAIPDALAPYSYSHPRDFYYDDVIEVTVSWEPPLDGSGWTSAASVLVSGDGTYTIFPFPGNSDSLIGSEGSEVGFNLGAIDESDNLNFERVGSWYASGVTDGTGFQALTRDGFLDIAHNEWLSSTEFLDDDERPWQTQSLWSTWDQERAFVGWQGASWGPDGTLWLYYDVINGGTTQPVSGTVTLPFEADFVVNAESPSTAYGWVYDGAVWGSKTLLSTPDTNPTEPRYSHDAEVGGTEMLIDGLGAFYPTQNLDHHRMVAFATDENDAVWSAFPTVNTLDGNFQYYYEWTNIINSWDLLKLPVSAQQPAVNMSIDSIPGVQDTVSTDETVQFVANITNMDSAAVSGVQLLISGTAGLTFQTATGAAAFDCSAGSACTIDVPPLALGGTDVITVTAVTDSDLSTIDYITTTAYLQADLPLPASDEILIHAVDTDAPIVFIYTNPGSAIGTGVQTVRGRAEDGVGSGVEFVEVSTDGSTWQLATGAQFWQAAITTPSGPTWNLYARATDFHGQTSPVAMVTLIEDTAAPIITATIPSVLRNSSITGFTRDPAPVGARVASVAMQLDNATAVWQNSTLYQPGAYGFVGQQLWRHIWPLPIEDGVTHTLRFRAVDTAGNVAHSAWFTTMVDIVPPAVTVNQQLTQIAVGSSDPVLAGSVTDGGGFYTATVAIYPAAGGYIEDVVALNGTQWSYTLDQPLGEYTLYLYFKDIAGNTYQLPQHTVDVVDVLPDVVIAPATSSDIELTWTPHGSYCQYNVYRSTSPYVGYALHAEDMASPYTDAGVLGNPALNYFYYVEWIACVGGGTAVTDEVGAFDFAIVPGN